MAFAARHDTLLALALALALAVGLVATAHPSQRHYSLEARQRAAVAADVIAGTSRGTQGLVGSLELAPLPTILIIFVGLVPLVSLEPMLATVVAAGAAAALALYVNALWRRHGVPAALRYGAMLCLMLLPPAVLSVQAGQTDVLFVALAVGGVGALVEWLRAPALRQLALSAVLLALAVATRYQGLLLVAAAAVLVATACLLRRRSWSFLEGTIITFALPGIYVVLLWIGGNWLILGNPVFFLRGAWQPWAPGGADAWALVARGCPWLLLGFLGALALSVPFATALASERRTRRPQQVAACLALLAAVALARQAHVPAGVQTASVEPRQVVMFLKADYPNGTFVVTGYAGYAFVEAARPDPQNHWVHVMHLRPEGLEKVLRDYVGREVYLLVDAGATRDRWDEVGLRWQREGSRIPERFLFARQVGEWSVFEVLRAQG
jgi:hypothetical protein